MKKYVRAIVFFGLVHLNVFAAQSYQDLCRTLFQEAKENPNGQMERWLRELSVCEKFARRLDQFQQNPQIPQGPQVVGGSQQQRQAEAEDGASSNVASDMKSDYKTVSAGWHPHSSAKVPVAWRPNPGQDVPMAFVPIESGRFFWGEDHIVELTQDFEMQRTEVTQQQWFEVMGSNPSDYKNQGHCQDEHRIVGAVKLCPNNPLDKIVSRADVLEFIARLNNKNDGYTYRLPTEAEWEYAARGGTSSAYFFGDSSSDLGRYAWHYGNTWQPQRVAKKEANPWGLYDVYGNVGEMVQDNIRVVPSTKLILEMDPLYTDGSSLYAVRGGSASIPIAGPHYRRYIRLGRRTSNTSFTGLRLIRIRNNPLPDIPIVFLPIKKGSFLMGSPKDEPGHTTPEETQVEVVLTYDFEMQATEVTQWQWFEIMGDNPSFFKTRKFCGNEHRVVDGVELCPNHPVSRATKDDIDRFLIHLNQKSDGYAYRLPTEAEWEYAARAGTTTTWFFGNDSSDLARYAWLGLKTYKTRRVAKKEANPWGLYDIYGNVFELVQDNVRFVTCCQGPVLGHLGGENPLYTDNHDWFVSRGGSIGQGHSSLRSAAKYYRRGDEGSGFRLVREPVGGQ